MSLSALAPLAGLAQELVGLTAAAVRGHITAQEAHTGARVAFARYDEAIQGLAAELAANDAAADAALRAKFRAAPAAMPAPDPLASGVE